MTSITFTPNLYRAGASYLGYNKYVVVGKITEYRRLPGSNRRYLVGSVRRDFLVVVLDGPGNLAPTVLILDVPLGCYPQYRQDTTLFTVNTCSYTPVRLLFTDPDNIATPTYPAVSPLQNLTVTYTGTGTIQTTQL